jgi:hypothetical protein
VARAYMLMGMRESAKGTMTQDRVMEAALQGGKADEGWEKMWAGEESWVGRQNSLCCL